MAFMVLAHDRTKKRRCLFNWGFKEIKMKTEREIFELWCIKDDEFCIHRYDGSSEYSDDYTQSAWLSWQASASREGYKLVPLEPNEAILEALQVGFKPDYEGGSYDSYEGYKAMIGAVD